MLPGSMPDPHSVVVVVSLLGHSTDGPRGMLAEELFSLLQPSMVQGTLCNVSFIRTRDFLPGWSLLCNESFIRIFEFLYIRRIKLNKGATGVDPPCF